MLLSRSKPLHGTDFDMTKLLFSSLTLAGILACYVMAQPPHPGVDEIASNEAILQLLDIDHDGQLSAKEIHEASSKLIELDANGDGAVTSNEFPRPRRPQQNNRSDSSAPRSDERGNVLFEGGHITDPRDGGRPVALIAAALNVDSDVFRGAFSGVTPARGGRPTPFQARANKKVLLDALAKYGVTNERLDEVSDFYRYQPQSGRLWQHRQAKAVAVIENDKVTSIKLIDAGAGYLTAPRAIVVGFPALTIDTQIELGTDLSLNGQISSLTIKQ